MVGPCTVTHLYIWPAGMGTSKTLLKILLESRTFFYFFHPLSCWVTSSACWSCSVELRSRIFDIIKTMWPKWTKLFRLRSILSRENDCYRYFFIDRIVSENFGAFVQKNCVWKTSSLLNWMLVRRKSILLCNRYNITLANFLFCFLFLGIYWEPYWKLLQRFGYIKCCNLSLGN